MRRRSREQKDRNRARCTSVSLCLSTICLFLSVSGVLAFQQVIYKEPKERKGLFPDQGQQDVSGVSKNKIAAAYIYDPTGKTDPFKPFIAEQKTAEEKKEEKKKPKTYLETLDLSQLDLIAIIASPDGHWAMVRDAKGLGYVVREGTPIGLRGGEVREISDRAIIIHEKYKDFRGKLKFRKIAKKLEP